MNSVVPARVGDAVKIFLAKRSIRRSTYTTVVSSFFVGSVFDTTAGILVFVYALTQGLLPRPPELPDLPAFDIAFWAQHPSLLVFTITALGILVVVLFAVLARRVEAFWDHIKQGAIVLATPSLYLRTVASWQGAGWLLRFFSYWFFLDAFNVGGSFQNVLLVMSVQTVANLLPLTPGRRGRPAGAAGRDPGRPGADRGAHLLGRPADRDRGLDRRPRGPRPDLRLPDDGLAPPDPQREPRGGAARVAGVRQLCELVSGVARGVRRANPIGPGRLSSETATTTNPCPHSQDVGVHLVEVVDSDLALFDAVGIRADDRDQEHGSIVARLADGFTPPRGTRPGGSHDGPASFWP